MAIQNNSTIKYLDQLVDADSRMQMVETRIFFGMTVLAERVFTNILFDNGLNTTLRTIEGRYEVEKEELTIEYRSSLSIVNQKVTFEFPIAHRDELKRGVIQRAFNLIKDQYRN